MMGLSKGGAAPAATRLPRDIRGQMKPEGPVFVWALRGEGDTG